MQKLGNDPWHDSELITIKSYSLIGSKWNSMLESHVDSETCIDWTSFNFWCKASFFEEFLSNLLWCYWPTVHALILKICRKFRGPMLHFSEVNKLLDAQWQKKKDLNLKWFKKILYHFSNFSYQFPVFLYPAGQGMYQLFLNKIGWYVGQHFLVHRCSHELQQLLNNVSCLKVQARLKGWVVRFDYTQFLFLR